MTLNIATTTINENSSAVCLSRVQDANGDNITQAAISSITYSVFDLNDTSTAIVAAASLTVADVVYDSLQTDSRWTADATGYNFAHELAGSSFPDGNRTYQIEYLFTPATGNPFYVVFVVDTKAIHSA